MTRRYQIEQQRAVNEFRRLATEQNPKIQMVLPMTEIVGLLQQGVGHLLREAGLALMSLAMEEVRHVTGERHQLLRENFCWDFHCILVTYGRMEIQFTTQVFKQRDTFVAHTPELDLSSCGDTEQKALDNLNEVVTLFLEEADKDMPSSAVKLI